jgi:DNA replication protein DnaC
VARQCAAWQVDYPRYLLRLTELELLDRDRRAVERRIRPAKFPVVKSLDSFEFLAIPSLNKALVLELARCEFLSRKENLLLLGNSGTGKTHIALALGLSACQRGHRVRFTTAAALVSELIEARDDKHLLRFQKLLASYELLIVDELGYVPLSKSGAELLFETFSQRYERGSTLVTSNLPFEEWTEVFGSERLTGDLLYRITHHVHILEMNGDSYWLKQSRRERIQPQTAETIPKVRDIVGLYMNSPERALVLCVDEKSQIQALDRTAPLLPMRPGQIERRTHDYAWHGTTSCLPRWIPEPAELSDRTSNATALKSSAISSTPSRQRAGRTGRSPHYGQLRNAKRS